MQHNPARNIRGFEPESILIIISCSLMHIEKEGMGCRLYILIEQAQRKKKRDELRSHLAWQFDLPSPSTILAFVN